MRLFAVYTDADSDLKSMAIELVYDTNCGGFFLPLFVSDFFKEKSMRLDKFLKVSRLIKRRTVANEACDAEKVIVNGKAVRASYEVKTGDIIEIIIGKPLKVRVLDIKEFTKKEDAAALYEVV